MKKLFLVFATLFCLAFIYSSSAQNGGALSPVGPFAWSVFGSAGISNNEASWVRIAVDTTDQPFVAYSNMSANLDVEVQTYKNGSWQQLGQAGFASGMDLSLALNKTGNPVVAMVQWHLPMVNQASVMEVNGTSSTYIGNQWFSAGDTYHTWIDINSSGEPWVVYQDAANNNKLSVMRYENAWLNVGPAGFTNGWSFNPVIKFNIYDTAYVAFRDGSQNGKASVMKFNGTAWEYVGMPGISNGDADSLSLAFSPDNLPCVSFCASGDNWKASVMKFDGTSWVYIGNEGFTSGAAGWTNLGFNVMGSPVIAFQDGGHGNKASVMEYLGGNWIYIGAPGFSPGSVTWVSMAVSRINGRYFVAFSDGANTNKVTVMEYNDIEGIPASKQAEFRINPNPANSFIHLSFNDAGNLTKQVSVCEISGKLIQSFTTPGQGIDIDISDLASGLYFIRSTSASGSIVLKFLKE